MRTTIEIKDKHRARLLELAARRGAKGFSAIVSEALDVYLKSLHEAESKRRAALKLRGTLSRETADALRAETAAIRRSWR